ncbi:MAG: hypothetical protein AAB719_01510 [Patescibacteria group bacterium]
MPPTQTQNPTPVQGQTPNKKTFLAILVIMALLALGYFLSQKYSLDKGPTSPEETNEALPMEVVVEHTQAVNGVLPTPKDFPKDIPVEKFDITESATTVYPSIGAKQLNISYQSNKSLDVKYKEYKDYMTKAGYTLSEGGTGANLKAIFGTKEKENLSVVVSSAGGGSLVQVAYLLKSSK